MKGTTPAIGAVQRRAGESYDKDRYRGRHLNENTFCRLDDFRRVATRYDKLAANFPSAIALATAVAPASSQGQFFNRIGWEAAGRHEPHRDCRRLLGLSYAAVETSSSTA
jgi:hypothetical protein